MSFTVPQDQCIWILEGYPRGPFGPMHPNTTPEMALACLKQMTGVDFGNDTVAWRKWFRENDPKTTQWFTLSDDEKQIAIIEGRDSFKILGFGEKPQARQHLIALTGQDFGYDGEAWRQWYRQQRPDVVKRFVYG